MSAPVTEIEIIGPYQIGKTIGQGIFAKVKLGEDEFRQKVAIKIFDKSLLSRSHHQLQQVEKELNSLRQSHHPNIVQFYEVLETDAKIYLVMEHLPHGELYDYILDKGRLSEEEGGKLFGQVVGAVEHIHKKGVVHRDLKPENILLTANFTVKLVDFGLANYYETTLDVSTRNLSTQCGSPHYAAPEILTGQKYSGPLADIWSLGVLLFAMLCGSLPFNARSVPLLIKKIVEGKFKFPKFLSPSSRHLISSILQIQPEQRPSIEEIMKHPWMQQYAIEAPSTENGEVVVPSPVRPLSRPEIISPETRHQPGDLARMMNRHSLSHRRSLINTTDDLPPANSLQFEKDDANAFHAPHSPVAPAPPPTVTTSFASAISDLFRGGSSPRKRKPIKCHICGKILNARISETGEFRLHSTGNKTNAKGVTAGEGSDKEEAGAVAGYELCSCMRNRSNSPADRMFDMKMERNQSASSLASTISLSTSIGNCSPSSNSRDLSSSNSSNNVAAGGESSSEGLAFQQSSLREDYFHPNDPRRKSKQQQLLASASTITAEKPLNPAEIAAAKKAEEERMKNEAKLIRACETGDADTVSKLIEPPTDENGLITGSPLVDVRAKTIDNLTGLHCAARAGHTNVVQALLSSLQPIDINSRTKSGWSPLMIASDQGKEEVCSLLVKYGAAIHITNSDGKSAIFLARESGHHEIAQMLTNASSQRHKRHTLLQTVISSPGASTGGANPEGEGGERSLNYELFRACEFGDLAKVTHLLSLAKDEDTHSHVSRRNATAQQQQQPQATVTAAPANGTSGGSPTSSPGPTLDDRPSAPRYSVDICAKGIDHWTALHFAARRNHLAILTLLLEHNPPAPINAVTKNGWTALMMACDKGHDECVAVLLQHGADVNVKSLDGYTALSVAQEGSYVACIRLLEQHIHSQMDPSNPLNGGGSGTVGFGVIRNASPISSPRSSPPQSSLPPLSLPVQHRRGGSSSTTAATSSSRAGTATTPSSHALPPAPATPS